MSLSHYVRLLILVLLVAGCGQPDRGDLENITTQPAPGTKSDIADLLRHPPPAGQPIEVDAYFTGAGVQLMTFDGNQCTGYHGVVLTDQPFQEFVEAITQKKADPAWIMVALLASHPNLPYHGRFQGYIVPECEGYYRFSVEKVLAVYEPLPATPIDLQKLPLDITNWGNGSPTTTPRPTVLTTPTPTEDPNATAMPTAPAPYPPPSPYPAPSQR